MLRVAFGKNRSDERGFTLIELMVVILVLLVLIALVIPTFLGARTKAQDRSAQVELRQGLLTAKTYFTDKQTYAALPVDLTALEPGLTFDDTVGNATSAIIGYTATDTSIVLALQSKSGKYFCISDSTGAGTRYAGDAALANVDEVAECDGSAW